MYAHGHVPRDWKQVVDIIQDETWLAIISHSCSEILKHQQIYS